MTAYGIDIIICKTYRFVLDNVLTNISQTNPNLNINNVFIKGTTIYDTKCGGFVGVSILDAMQIFCRAGRPQFDKVGCGEAFIITRKKRLRHYIAAMTNSTPIESKFHTDLSNHLNAEIVLGSVTNMSEAILWLQYTYLYVRLIRSPSKYMDTTSNFFNSYNIDPFFSSKLREMLEDAAMELAKVKWLVLIVGIIFMQQM